MFSQFLLPETVARQDGAGAKMEIEFRIVRLTLGITRIIEQENLEVSVWGSPDGKQWRHLVTFPQKFYCGTYSMVIDLGAHPDVRPGRRPSSRFRNKTFAGRSPGDATVSRRGSPIRKLPDFPAR